ncbi:L,D-transpeptidase family protein [Pedobacter nyackensis]|uniref:L,D-transpeptidase family protein n=1 Tax=Pedobacter nyackensis TaxID=475255 RepID=UPI00292CD8E8|nr:L,D-transpeptidase family protein [Pedobacter nyackensis]
MILLTNISFIAKMKVRLTLSLLVMLYFMVPSVAMALSPEHKGAAMDNDTSVIAVIRNLITTNAGKKVFYYPKSLERFYNKSQFQPKWIKPDNDNKKTWEALLMLDCVLQFGLNHTDYHPKELLFTTMHDILENSLTVSASQKAWFDMLLSDALITFMNHLHFGKLNPVFTPAFVDKGEVAGFCAEDILADAMIQNDFISAVLNVQPKIKEYVLMQDYMKLLKGQYVGDCYEAPEGIVRKLAINMERLRWAAINEDSFIQINIPSYTLKLHVPDSTYKFKVVVGKPISPTPVLNSSISYFSTAPDWKVPAKIFVKEMLPRALKDPQYLENNHLAIYDGKGNFVVATKDSLMLVRKNPGKYFMRQSAGCDNALGLVVFRFQNPFSIYLHDTPEQQFFDREVRALSHGCIRVQYAEKLASILLTLDGQKNKIKLLHQAMGNYQPQNFNLRKSVPLIITYLTCEVGEIGVVEYDDIYKKDKALELAFYGGETSSPAKELDIKSINR